MASALREDDFFVVKLGLHMPKCPPLRWAERTAAEAARAEQIAGVVRSDFPDGSLEGEDPLFSFVETLGEPPPPCRRRRRCSRGIPAGEA